MFIHTSRIESSYCVGLCSTVTIHRVYWRVSPTLCSSGAGSRISRMIDTVCSTSPITDHTTVFSYLKIFIDRHSSELKSLNVKLMYEF